MADRPDLEFQLAHLILSELRLLPSNGKNGEGSCLQNCDLLGQGTGEKSRKRNSMCKNI